MTNNLGTYLGDVLLKAKVFGLATPPGEPPLQQAQLLFQLLQRPPRIKHVPLALMDGICGTLGLAARVLPALQAKAEFARIGRYYASESMLVW
ncbi:MAG TPA: hypothetical protein PLA44_14130, partial [Propionibacteriaceae bacterium]|nr:hypothetical protein [Propionibacteriaceae bacterium]